MSEINHIDWAKAGYTLIGDEAWFSYCSGMIEPDRWICQYARHPEHPGELYTIWWYYTPEAEALSEETCDGGDWVEDWSKCAEIVDNGKEEDFLLM